jgi:MFS family permease
MQRMFRSPLLLMALTVFIDIAGFGLVLPLLPFWAEHLGAGSVGVGMILTAYALAQFLFTPLLGSYSDRYGRRPIIILSLLIEAIAFALSALASTLPVLLVARFIGGLGASNIGSAQAVVADVTPPEGRARGMGMIGAAIGMGFVIGPAAGGVLAALGNRLATLGGAFAVVGPSLPFWVSMLIAFANALLVWRFLPETHPRQAEASSAATIPSGRHGSPFASLSRALQNPAVTRLILVNLIFTLAFTAMEAVFPLFTQNRFGWTAAQNGYIFAYVGIVIVIMQGGMVGRLVRRFGEHRLQVAGLALLAGGLLLLPLNGGLALLVVALGVLSIGEGAVTPTTSALLSFASPAESQGELLGLAQGMGGLGRVIGPLAAGWLFSAAGIGAPFAIAGALTVLALLLAIPALPEGRVPRTAEAPDEPVAPEVAPLTSGEVR